MTRTHRIFLLCLLIIVALSIMGNGGCGGDPNSTGHKFDQAVESVIRNTSDDAIDNIGCMVSGDGGILNRAINCGGND